MQHPLIFGHRGTPVFAPEHSRQSYELALEAGADGIEVDVVCTRDGQLVALHDAELSLTTDVDTHPELASRRTVRMLDGVRVEGWFVDDLDLSELRRLRRKERFVRLGLHNRENRGPSEFLTIAEVLDLACGVGRPVRVLLEVKHSNYFRARGLPIEERLMGLVEQAVREQAGAFSVSVLSFEVENLQAIHRRDLPMDLVQLIGAPDGRPADRARRGQSTRYSDMTTRPGLREIVRYADAIGVDKDHLGIWGTTDRSFVPTSLVADAHRAGLRVLAYTFRPENQFLPEALRSRDDPSAWGGGDQEAVVLSALGLDGLIGDDPESLVALRNRGLLAVAAWRPAVRGQRSS